MKVLVVGSGGREHALAWQLARSPRVKSVFCAPGNAGIAQVAQCRPIPSTDVASLVALAWQEGVDLTVVGPEAPLAAGIVDAFRGLGLRIFGPDRAAAALESSKVFAKQLLQKYGIPTGGFAVFEEADKALAHVATLEPPIVVKADGLAAGKGVTVAATREEAEAAVRAAMTEGVFGEAGRRVVIEEFLEGPEVSVMAFAAGEEMAPMVPAQDHKAVLDGDRGPNTGGMGCYSPVPALSDALLDQAFETIMRPTLAAMAAEGRPYCGVLYGGLILTSSGPKALEFNCRFGDPETQVVLPRLETDLVDLLEATAEGELGGVQAQWSPQRAVCVVMASAGYPDHYETGQEIYGLEDAQALPDVIVFHAATRARDGRTLTAGGRVLGVTGLGNSYRAARDRAYSGVAKIRFEGAHCRRDIAARALAAND